MSDSVDGLFAINPQSGAVSVAMNQLDFEAFSSHTITVQANSASSSGTMSFIIRVTDVNEPAGPITDINFNPNRITLGSMSGDTVGITARAADPDQGGTVIYSLSEDPTGLFAINPQDGVITLASDNYSPDQDYLIEVKAEAAVGPASAKEFTVRLEEPIPITPSPTRLTLREGESQGITLSFAETGLELIALSAGNYHTCGITPGNDAICWGDDREDSDNMLVGKSMPPANQKFIAISAGGNHSCGITPDNDAVCWGFDRVGSTMPPANQKFIAVSAGSNHTCAITPDNDAVCWGVDGNRQASSGIPEGKFIAISSGEIHTCAITTDNDAVCWGGTSSGDVQHPPRGRKFIAISAGYFGRGGTSSCGITLDNKAVCWGGYVFRPPLPSNRKLIAIDTQTSHTCGITPDNDAVCWGRNNDKQSAPPPGRKFIAIEIGSTRTCGLTTDNKAVCWGRNSRGPNQPPEKGPAPPPIADPITIAAMIPDAHRGQISVSDNAQAVIPAGSTQIALTVTAIDDNFKESTADYAIPLTAAGHAALERDELIITVTVDGRDVVEDVEGEAGGMVAENSSTGTAVGITIRAGDATTYTLTDSAGGRFAIGVDTGIVSVADGSLLNFEEAASHTIVVEAGNASGSTAQLTILIANVNEITLEDTDDADNTVSADTTVTAVIGLALRATHTDNVGIVSWELDDASGKIFALTEPQNSAAQTLRIRDGVDISSVSLPDPVTVTVRTAHDMAQEGFTIKLVGGGIILRVRVYLEGALE